MDSTYQLVISGKNIVLNAAGFIEALSYDAVTEEQDLSITKGIAEITRTAGSPALLATVHNGQPIILDNRPQKLSEKLESALQQFTLDSGTDALSIFRSAEGQFTTYHYFRDGKLLRAVTQDGNEFQKEGINIPYEDTGVDPSLVLTSFCDSWMVLQQLSWTVYRLAPKLAHEQE